jgi:hypothetical protein
VHVMSRLALLSAFVLTLCQCAPYRAAWQHGWTNADAEDSIMLVLADPPSLGWKRLQQHSALHPEFRSFLNQMGQPDCLAESVQGDRRYIILYYLEQRRAFSLRTAARSVGEPMQVSGPYPITDKEYALLSSFQNKALRSIGR